MLIGMPSQPRIGARIRRARQHLGMSQEQLAARIGASRSAVNAWERDRAWPRNIVRLEEVLGVSLEAEAEPGPLDDLKVAGGWLHDWERQTAEAGDLPVELRRRMIL